jgi:hypothetical protein
MVFSYLFQPKTVTAFYAYPLTRVQLLLTNGLAGFLMLLGPLALACLLLAPPVALPPQGASILYLPGLWPQSLQAGATLNTLPVLAGFFGRSLLAFTFFYALSLLAVLVCGNPVMSALVALGLALLPIGLEILVEGAGTYFYFGFEMPSNTLEWLLRWINPGQMGELIPTHRLVQDSWTFTPTASAVMLRTPPNLGAALLCQGLLAAGMLAVCLWAGRARKPERAGDALVFRGAKNAAVFLLALLGMITLGTSFLNLFRSWAALYIGFAAGFALVFFLAQMVAGKTFMVWDKRKDFLKHGGVALGLYLALLLVTRLDLVGYVRHSPAAEEVTGVYTGSGYGHFPYEIGGTQDLALRLRERMFTQNPESVAEALAVHRTLVEARGALLPFQVESAVGVPTADTNPWSINLYQFRFRTADGKVVARTYRLPWSVAQASGLKALLARPDMIRTERAAFQAPDLIQTVTVHCARNIPQGPYSKGTVPIALPPEDSDPVEISGDARNFPEFLEALGRDYAENKLREWAWQEDWAADNTTPDPPPGVSLTATVQFRAPEYDKESAFQEHFYLNFASQATRAWLVAEGYLPEAWLEE